MLQYERLNQDRNTGQAKHRVAAYCRVSTDREDQANSFASQQRYFRQYIERHPDWELYEIFADEGISGTNTKKRRQFNRMIACAKNGEFDLIVTKEISRFARNTLDSIYYTRELKQHGVGVIFLNDNLNTLDGDAELRLAILSSIAQEESRRTSERVKWGQKRRMEQGIVFGRSMLGYDVKGGKITVNEAGAEIVRRIFRKFVEEGKGTHVIARELQEEGVAPMRAGQWQNTVILRVIRNEKYCGDLVQKKTYTPDFLSHEKKYNRGQEEFVVIRNHHEPIVSRELFEKANRILDAKSHAQKANTRYTNRYPLSGKIKCGQCGASYVARYRTRKDGSQYKAWRCLEGVRHGKPHLDKAGNQVGCAGGSIRNEDAVYLMSLVCGKLRISRQEIADTLLKIIETAAKMDLLQTEDGNLAEKLEQARKKRTGLIDLYTSGEIDRSEFHALRAKYDGEVERWQSVTQCMEQQEQWRQDVRAAIEELLGGVAYEDPYYTQILDRIVVNDPDHMDVYLKLLPQKWQFVAKTPENGTAQATQCAISEASVPISVSRPFSSS